MSENKKICLDLLKEANGGKASPAGACPACSSNASYFMGQGIIESKWMCTVCGCIWWKSARGTKIVMKGKAGAVRSSHTYAMASGSC